jgi:hypothetical protein
MDALDTVVAVYNDHEAADKAVKLLGVADFDMQRLSVVGKGYHTDEKVVGFYNVGDRIKLWGSRGAFWGGLWGLLFSGLLVSIPVVGHVVVLGYLAAAAISAIEGAVVVGGASAVGAALLSIGIPKDSVVQYESEVKADGFLVMVHGSAAETVRAKAILAATHPERLVSHVGTAGARERRPVLHLSH